MSSPIGSKNNVKIFVLYLMENIGYPLDFVTINDIVMQTDYVMYLDFAESFNEMLDSGLIEELKNRVGDPEYVVTEKGRCVARELRSDILPSILDKSLACALRYIDFSRRGIEANCTIEPREDGRYDFNCSFEEKRNKIFRISLVVDSFDRAKRMKDNFINRPEVIYRGVFALLAGNVNYLFD
ncbi:MAG: DUF4364 family protein [Clostridiales bacterium]|nr:DUF4364 family protein [Clostridiales bacterium]